MKIELKSSRNLLSIPTDDRKRQLDLERYRSDINEISFSSTRSQAAMDSHEEKWMLPKNMLLVGISPVEQKSKEFRKTDSLRWSTSFRSETHFQYQTTDGTYSSNSLIGFLVLFLLRICEWVDAKHFSIKWNDFFDQLVLQSPRAEKVDKDKFYTYRKVLAIIPFEC